jgi:hypothetical protein
MGDTSSCQYQGWLKIALRCYEETNCSSPEMTKGDILAEFL